MNIFDVLNMLGGMDTIDEGSVLVDGRDIARYSRKELITYRRLEIGLIFQFYNLIQNLTAKENVELAAQTCKEEKTILCGHWHCSYGHAVYEHKGSEFGSDADFSPYYGPGIIALDACTAHSRKVNVIVIEDDI